MPPEPSKRIARYGWPANGSFTNGIESETLVGESIVADPAPHDCRCATCSNLWQADWPARLFAESLPRQSIHAATPAYVQAFRIFGGEPAHAIHILLMASDAFWLPRIASK